MLISKQHYDRMVKLIPESADRMKSFNKINDLLEYLHSEIVAHFDKNDEPTQKSNMIEDLMDEIYWQNTH